MMLWVEAFHIIFVICWFAGMFYLPRLFVYHAMAEDKTSLERFKVMERKLYRGIALPSMILTIIFGLWLVSFNKAYYLHAGWFHAKITLVVLLVIYQLISGHYVKQFRLDKNTHSHVFYRWFNEIPVIFLIIIVILVVVKPF